MKKQVLFILVMVILFSIAFSNEVIQKITVVPNEPPQFSVFLRTDRGDWPTYNTGESIGFEFGSNMNVYVLLISINKDGQINLLLPNAYDPNNSIFANTTNYLPRSGYKYQIDTYGQGTEHVLLLATRQRTDLLNRIISAIKSGSIRDAEGLGAYLQQIVPSAGSDWAQATTSYYCNYQPTASSSSFVLLSVGISEYRTSPLKSPAKDAQAFAELMQNKYGFTDVTILTNSNATKSGILNALSSIQNRIRSNQTFVFFFSGHGGQIQDDNGDEEDNLDEVLCPYDFDSSNKRASSIVDDQLNPIIQNIAQKAGNVIFIFDSCFSGSATKSLKNASADLVNVRYKTTSLTSLGAESGKKALDLKDLPNFAFIASSKGTEPSLDTYDQFGHSLFTYFLLQAMKGAADTNANGIIDTYELFRFVSSEILKLSQSYGEYLQTPVLDPQNKAIGLTK